MQELSTRARTFVRWLLYHPESHIAVVSHGSFIYHMCHLFGIDCSRDIQDNMHPEFGNCEMRSVVLFDRLASCCANVANTNFAGGVHY
jgi:broad specificity phosphatase PhoE